jgi:hypothetical protein
VVFLAAVFADSIDLKTVPGCEVVVFVADFLFELADFRRKKFDRTAALRAHHMMVAATIVLMFVAGEAVVKRDFAGQTALGKQL